MTVQSTKKEPLLHSGHFLTKVGLVLLFVAVCIASFFSSAAEASDEFTGNDLR
jgi:uncharacterized membrane protein